MKARLFFVSIGAFLLWIGGVDFVMAQTNCPQVVSPVCTLDNVTYPNSCLAQEAQKAIAYPGICLSDLDIRDAQKTSRVVDFFLAKVFFNTLDLSQKISESVRISQALSGIQKNTKSVPMRTGMRTISQQFDERSLRFLSSHFKAIGEAWLKENARLFSPLAEITNDMSIVRVQWGAIQQKNEKLFSTVEVAFANSFREVVSVFDISFQDGFRVVPVIPLFQNVSLKKNGIAKIQNASILVHLSDLKNKFVQTSWYANGQVRRISKNGEAFGYSIQLVGTDFSSFATFRITPQAWR